MKAKTLKDLVWNAITAHNEVLFKRLFMDELKNEDKSRSSKILLF